jgi:hypothetical protein
MNEKHEKETSTVGSAFIDSRGKILFREVQIYVTLMIERFREPP